jgi:hypothetical protein
VATKFDAVHKFKIIMRVSAGFDLKVWQMAGNLSQKAFFAG